MSAAVHETMFQPEMHLYCIQYVPGQGYQRHPDSSRKWKFKWIELYMGIYAWKVKVNHLELSRAQSASLEDLTAAPAEKVKSASSCDQYSNQYFVSVVNYSPSNWCWVQKVGQYTIYIVCYTYLWPHQIFLFQVQEKLLTTINPASTTSSFLCHPASRDLDMARSHTR